MQFCSWFQEYNANKKASVPMNKRRVRKIEDRHFPNGARLSFLLRFYKAHTF
jgi:hypothetical protein